jgi:hypothetical protein
MKTLEQIFEENIALFVNTNYQHPGAKAVVDILWNLLANNNYLWNESLFVNTFKFKVKSKRDVFVKRHLGNDLERFKCTYLLEILNEFEGES